MQNREGTAVINTQQHATLIQRKEKHVRRRKRKGRQEERRRERERDEEAPTATHHGHLL